MFPILASAVHDKGETWHIVNANLFETISRVEAASHDGHPTGPEANASQVEVHNAMVGLRLLLFINNSDQAVDTITAPV